MRSSKRANAQLRAQVERLQAENQVLQKLHAVAAPAPAAAAPAATDGAAIGAAGPSVPDIQALPAIVTLIESPVARAREEGTHQLAILVEAASAAEGALIGDFLREAGGIELLLEQLVEIVVRGSVTGTRGARRDAESPVTRDGRRHLHRLRACVVSSKGRDPNRIIRLLLLYTWHAT